MRIYLVIFLMLIGLVSSGQGARAAAPAAHPAAIAAAIDEWKRLSGEDADFSFARGAAFLKTHRDWPLARRIQAAAERVLPDNLSPAQIFAFYGDETPVTAKGMRAYLRAAQAVGRTHAAYQTLRAWFVRADMGISDQDEMVTTYRSLLIPYAGRARLDYLLETEQIERAAALALQLGEGPSALVAAVRTYASNPDRARDLTRRLPGDLRAHPALLVAALKYFRAQENTDAARDFLLSLSALSVTSSQTALGNEQQSLVYALLDERAVQDAYRIAARFSFTDEAARAQAAWLAGYVALIHLHQPGRAFEQFQALYTHALSPLSKARSAYYAARASADLGYGDVASAWWRVAAGYRTNFYGQLAAMHVQSGAPVTYTRPPTITDKDRARFNARDLPAAVRYLARQGDEGTTRVFLSRLADLAGDHGGELRLVVDLAREVGQVASAVKIARASAMKGVDFSDYMFPITPRLAASDVEPAFVYAVIRQESAFDTQAVSRSGARGLMQLMPTTAAEVAGRADLRHQVAWLTARPAHNIELGRAYLKRLLDKYDGSYALAAAAYNAGPTRVNDWLEVYGDPRTGETDLISWIERIPFYETRTYVQRVLEGTTVYRGILKTTPTANLDAMHLGKW